jgi:NADH:ubiquinone oxidoreductase subunit K
MTPLAGCLLASSMLFAVGLAGALTRRNTILVLVGIELMLNAANLNFVAFWRFGPHPNGQAETMTGMIFVLFSIGVAAAEAAVGLALILLVYRHAKTTDLSQLLGRRR